MTILKWYYIIPINYAYKESKYNFRHIIFNVVTHNVIYYQNKKDILEQKMSKEDEISGKHSQQH